MEENFSAIFKKSYDLFLKNIKVFSIVFFIFFVPMVVLILLGGGIFTFLKSADGGFFVISILVSGIAFIAITLFALLYSIALIKTIHNAAQGQAVSGMEMYKEARGVLKPFAVVSVIVFIKVLLWSLLLIIPGIIFSVLYSFSQLSVILDEKRGNEALVLSKSVIKANLKEFLLKMLALMGVALLISIISSFMVLIPYVGFIINEAVKIALGIYAMIFSYYLYQDLKSKAGAEG
ncbi:MAG: hypothetical protein P9M12_03205 [Candidatus Aceula lacicola]|nr:hypothetical protein [Candidatus Aceula lacicola]